MSLSTVWIAVMDAGFGTIYLLLNKQLTEIVHACNFTCLFFVSVCCVCNYEHVLFNSPSCLILLYLFCCINTIHNRHFKVHYYYFVDTATFLEWSCLDHLKCLSSVDRFFALKLELTEEYLLQNVSVHVNVINDQDLRTLAYSRDMT